MKHTSFWRLLTSALVLLGVVLAGSTFLLTKTYTAGTIPLSVVISELKPGGGTGKTTDEFIELYNPTLQTINVSGWRVAKLTKAAHSNEYTFLVSALPTSTLIGSYQHLLVAHRDYIGLVTPDIVYDGNSLADDNTVVLLNSAGLVVDLVGYGNAGNFESGVALAPTTQLLSLERLPGGGTGNGQDTQNNGVDFVRAYPSPQNLLSPSTPTKVIATASVTSTIEVIDIPTTTVQITETSSSPIVEPVVVSSSPSSSLIFVTTSIPTSIISASSFSLELFTSSTSTTTVQSTVAVTTTSAVVSSTTLTEPQVVTPKAATAPGSVIISEFVSSPVAGEDEFVELYNRTTQVIDVSAWWLEEGGGSKTLLTGVINGQDRLVISKPKGSLNNGGDLIILKSSDSLVIDQVTYGDWDDGNINDNAPVAAAGSSVIRKQDSTDTNIDVDDFVVTSVITKGSANVSPTSNNQDVSTNNNQIVETVTTQSQTTASSVIRPRITGAHKTTVNISVSFDASSSTGGSGDLDYVWDFGDGVQDNGEYVEHSYKQSGSYHVLLTIHDELNKVKTKTWSIRVVENNLNYQSLKNNLIISEIYPSPRPQEIEFIELYNQSTTTLSIAGLLLDDDSGGSKPFLIPPGEEILAKHFRVFTRYETGLSLGPKDQVRLLDPESNQITSVDYKDAKIGFSYNYLDDFWQWSLEPTPGKFNKIILEDSSDDGTLEVQGATLIDRASIKSTTKKTSKTKIVNQVVFTTLSGVDEAKLDSTITLTGVVVAEPNSYATREFYLVRESGEITSSTREGMRVQYKKDTPLIVAGDTVTVTGKLQEKNKERYLVVVDSSLVAVKNHDEPLSPRTKLIKDILKLKGGFFTVEGTITESKKQYWYVDDGSGEVQIFLPKGIKSQPLGTAVGITGVLTNQNSEFILKPRNVNDVHVITSTTTMPNTLAKHRINYWPIGIITGLLSCGFGFLKFKKYTKKKTLALSVVNSNF